MNILEAILVLPAVAVALTLFARTLEIPSAAWFRVAASDADRDAIGVDDGWVPPLKRIDTRTGLSATASVRPHNLTPGYLVDTRSSFRRNATSLPSIGFQHVHCETSL